jgi:hypothetical protein
MPALVLRADYEAAQVRRLAAASSDADQSRRPPHNSSRDGQKCAR